MNIPKLIEKGVMYWGDKTAVIDDNKKFSFRQVNERANRLANGLLDLGYLNKKHIATLMNNRFQFIEIYFAQQKLNSVRITLNTRLSAEELAWQINDSEVDYLIVDAEHLELIESIKKNLKTVKRFIAINCESEGFMPYEDILSGSSGENPEMKSDEEDLGRIGYTTGTTGRPKGIMTPKRAEIAIMRNLLLDNIQHLNHKDVFLGLQPLYHAVWTYILPCWIKGAAQVITHDFSPGSALNLIQREKVTILKTVPTVLTRIFDFPGMKDFDLQSIHTIIYGASPIPVEKLKKGIELFGHIFIQNYGQAEAPMTICTMNKEDHIIDENSENTGRLSSVGRPYTMVEVRVVDDEGNDVDVGEPGEVAVKGDHMMTGYWKQPPETSESALKDGWLLTGDIGRLDAEGYLYLVDRKKEMIITGGLNVFPNEVEQVIYRHPAVSQVAVFGIPDKDWGESITAAVALKSGSRVGEEELIDFCRNHLARYKVPKKVFFHQSLPRSAAGKIMRRELREPFWKDSQRKIN